MKRYLISLWQKAYRENEKNILKLLEPNPKAKFLDLGCGNGKQTLKFASKIGTNKIYGIEIDNEAIAKKEKGIYMVKGDLNKRFPFKDNFFDVICANQIIEHLTNVDGFIQEIFRVLKNRGYAIISTENLSSAYNLFALSLGQQAFSQHISEKYHIGNILSPHFGENLKKGYLAHKIIFSYFGLKHLFMVYKFKVEKIICSGFPFFSRIDQIHSHFIAMKVRKII